MLKTYYKYKLFIYIYFADSNKLVSFLSFCLKNKNRNEQNGEEIGRVQLILINYDKAHKQNSNSSNTHISN